MASWCDGCPLPPIRLSQFHGEYSYYNKPEGYKRRNSLGSGVSSVGSSRTGLPVASYVGGILESGAAVE
jgi:hypothetical protein